ncbi:MAG: insulinase family protein [Myxococcota bacterium]|nr:insulinase family protein [Myxococcota bacterium]
MILWGLVAVVMAAPERDIPELGELVVPERPTVGQYELSGGGEVWVLERRDFPRVGVEVSISWDGTLSPPKERLGARLASMLMDTGPSLDRPEALLLDDLGVQWSAGIDDKHLWGTLVAPSGREEDALEALAGLLLDTQLNKKALRSRRSWWVDWRSQLEYDLDRVHERSVNHGVFMGGHPWRQMVQPEDLAGASWRTARKMPSEIARRGKLRIAVVGDIDTSEFLPLLEETFGHLQGREHPLPSVPPRPATGLHLVDQAGFGVARISLVFPIPGREDPKHFVAEALSHALAGRETSRLDLALREESGLSYAVSSDITATTNWGLIRLDTEVLPENVGKTLESMRDLLSDVAENGLTEQEFEAVRSGLILDRTRRLERTDGAMFSLAELQRSRQAPDTHHAQASAFQLLTAAELAEEAKSILAIDQAIWFVTGSAELIRPQIEALDWSLTTDTDAALLSRSP